MGPSAGALGRRARLAPLTATGLCVIVDPALAQGRSVEQVARLALQGGAGMIQLRHKGASDRELLAEAVALRSLCAAAGALFIVNDRADVAVAADADGVHVGQQDLPVAAARRIVGLRKLIGCSTATLEEAVAAQAAGADYLGVGTIYPTASKADTRPAGLATLKLIREGVSLPLVAIGGINQANAGEAIESGADAVAVISAVVSAEDIAAAAAGLAQAVGEARRRAGL